MSTYFIRNACVATTGDKIDMTVAGGMIESISPAGSQTAPSGASLVDAGGSLVLPGLFDLHAHLGQPGYENRERIATATAAALHGGVTGLQAMPDTSPVMDNSAQIQSLLELCQKQSPVTVIPTGCITKGAEGEEQVSYDSLRAKGVQFITDADHVPSNMLLLYRAMQYAAPLGITFALRGDVPALTAKGVMHPSPTSYRLGLAGSPVCAEEIGIDTIIRLAAATEASLHVQTVSTAGGAEAIRQWKKERPNLSAEVALHHLLFTHENVGDYDTTYKTLPPLRDQKDKDALIAALQDGTIDCIVSDHTPVTPFEKKQDFCVAPHGMALLDTFLPALYAHLVKPGLLTWHQIVTLCCDNPRKLMHLPNATLEAGVSADFVLFNPDENTVVTEDFLKSRSRNTPFLGQTIPGKVQAVFVNGKAHLF